MLYAVLCTLAALLVACIIVRARAGGTGPITGLGGVENQNTAGTDHSSTFRLNVTRFMWDKLSGIMASL